MIYRSRRALFPSIKFVANANDREHRGLKTNSNSRAGWPGCGAIIYRRSYAPLVRKISGNNGTRWQTLLPSLHPPPTCLFFFFFFNAAFVIAGAKSKKKVSMPINGGSLPYRSTLVHREIARTFVTRVAGNERRERDFNLRCVTLKQLIAFVTITRYWISLERWEIEQ